MGRLTGTLEGEMNHPDRARIGFGAIDVARLERSIALMVETKKLPRLPPVNEIFTSEFLPPLAERVGR